MYGRGEKTQDGDRDDHGDQRGPRGAIEVKQRVCILGGMCLGNKKTRKQTGRQKETAKQGRTNRLYQGHKLQNKMVTRKCCTKRKDRDVSTKKKC